MRPDQWQLAIVRLVTNGCGGKLSQSSHKQVTRLVLLVRARPSLSLPVTFLCHERTGARDSNGISKLPLIQLVL